MRRILHALIALLLLAVPAAAQKTTTQITSDINTNLPDNTTGQITPSILRSMLIEMLTNAGIDGNALNAQTAAYPLATTDCGKTVTLGGTAFYTLTVGAASGFPATCTVVVVNIDSGRGKKMTINGVTFPNNSILWPLQSFTLKNENNVWAIVNPPGRWRAPNGGVTFNISSSGLDTNDGLGTGAGAFLTIGGGLAVVSNILDAGGQALTVQVSCSALTTFTENIMLPVIVGAVDGGGVGSTTPALTGNTTTPSNCVIDGSAGGGTSTILAIRGNEWIVQGFQFKSTTGGCILVDVGGWIRGNAVEVNTCAGAGGNGITVENGGLYEVNGNHTFSGANYSVVAYATLGGRFLYASGVITCLNNPVTAAGWAFSERNSLQYWGGATFSGCGGVTGPRYRAVTGGGIDTNGGGATFFPGNSAGSAANPSWYN